MKNIPIRLEAAPLIAKQIPVLQARVEAFRRHHGRAPSLKVFLVGDDPASEIYTSRKAAFATRLGIDSELVVFSKDALVARVREQIIADGQDPRVDGILIQRPLLSGFAESEVRYWIPASKDVDGIHPENFGKLVAGDPGLVACTPQGIMRLLDFYNIQVEGKLVGVLGRSAIVGRPMAALLSARNATVIQLHSKTLDPAALTRQCDILVVAIGRPEWLTASFVKPGATVIDVGIHRAADGSKKVIGDVAASSVSSVCGALSPVPGGVGPLTILELMENTIAAAERSKGV